MHGTKLSVPQGVAAANSPRGIDRALLMKQEPLPLERWLTRRNARLALLVIALVSAAASLSLRHVRFDYDFEKFFPNDDPELARYLSFRERFGHDNDLLMFGLERMGGVFNREFLVRADSLTAKLERLPRVVRVLSPTRLSEPIITPVGMFERPYLRFDNDTLPRIDSASIRADPRIHEQFFGENGNAMLVVLTAEPGLSKAKSDSLLAGARRALVATGFADARIAGRIVGQEHYISTMVKETLFFLCASIALLAVFLWIAFRSTIGVVVPIVVVGTAILWQVALMTAMGRPLGILTMLLPTILFVVGMSDTVHLLECYLEEIRSGATRTRAIAATWREAGLPTFLTAVTSAIGFATLGTASIPPLREFGLFTAGGVLLAFVLSFALLPALLVLIPPDRLSPRVHHTSALDRYMPGILRWALRYRRAVLLGCGVIAVLGTVGTMRIRVNNFLLEDLPDNDPMKAGFHWFEHEFGGVRPFEMEITTADGNSSVWDQEALRRIERVQNWVDTAYGVDAILSPVTVMYSLNKALNGGDGDFYHLSTDSADLRRMAHQARSHGNDLLGTIASSDGRSARLTGRQVDEGGYIHQLKNARLSDFITSEGAGPVRFHQTGIAYLIDRNNARLSTQMVLSMGLAVVLTALIMLWFFHDPRMVLAALLPNLLPLLFIAGVMGYVGIDLKVSTAIIFSIAFGIAEDDTIHMLAALRQHMRSGLSPAYALKRTCLRTGKAVTVTGLMLLSGFVTLIFSDFASIRYMGILITLTLAFALVVELLLLPVLVVYLLRHKR